VVANDVRLFSVRIGSNEDHRLSWKRWVLFRGFGRNLGRVRVSLGRVLQQKLWVLEVEKLFFFLH
jgi:hypothetical protein